MSKLQRHRSEWGDGVVLEVPVPETAKSGVPLAFGTAGLYGIPETERVTDQSILMGLAAASLRPGNASVMFPGIGQTRDFSQSGLTLPDGIQNYDKVYLSGGQLAASGDLFLGWRLGNLVLIRDNA